MPVLDERCGEQFTNCCQKAKSRTMIEDLFSFLRCMSFSFYLVNCDTGFEMNDDERCRGKCTYLIFWLNRLLIRYQ